jgi:hypothetical protein
MTLIVRNINGAIVASMVGSGCICVWLESIVRRSDLVDVFVRNLASAAVKMLSHLIYFISLRKTVPILYSIRY